jgi:hypothetical protein
MLRRVTDDGSAEDVSRVHLGEEREEASVSRMRGERIGRRGGAKRVVGRLRGSRVARAQHGAVVSAHAPHGAVQKAHAVPRVPLPREQRRPQRPGEASVGGVKHGVARAHHPPLRLVGEHHRVEVLHRAGRLREPQRRWRGRWRWRSRGRRARAVGRRRGVGWLGRRAGRWGRRWRRRRRCGGFNHTTRVVCQWLDQTGECGCRTGAQHLDVGCSGALGGEENATAATSTQDSS